jgi:hypothetical protein
MKTINLLHKKKEFIYPYWTSLSCMLYAMLVFVVLLTGCQPTKDLTRGKVPVEVRPQLRAKRTYHVITQSGEELVIRVTKVDFEKVEGFVSYTRSGLKKVPYEETLDNLYQNATKISKDRNDVLLIIGTAGVLTAVITFMIAESDLMIFSAPY